MGCGKMDKKLSLSLVIPAKSLNDPKLKELLESIEGQECFPKEDLEVLVITEGTSESAKAIGIRRAKGEIIGILASDNVIHKHFLSMMCNPELLEHADALYPAMYHYYEKDDILNRYFSLIGGNDPLSFYMHKNDKNPHQIKDFNKVLGNTTIGDNGFFIKKYLIENTDLDNYYHIDNAIEALPKPARIAVVETSIWHKTGGNIFKFYSKRYHYGLQHAFNTNRRWHLVDFNRKEDICRLVWFITASLTVVHPLMTSIRGYQKVRDLAWFLHPICCMMTLLTYSALMIQVACTRLYQSLFVHTDAQRA